MADQPQYRRDPEFVDKVVRLLTTTERTVAQAAEDLGVSPTTVARIAADQKLNLNLRRGVWEHGSEDLWRKIRELLDSTALPTNVIAGRLGIALGKLQQHAYRNNYSLKQRNLQLKAGVIAPVSTEPLPKTATGKVDINQLWKPRR